MRPQNSRACSQTSEAQNWWVAMLPSKTSSRAKENMSMPLKSVAKGSTHLWAILWA